MASTKTEKGAGEYAQEALAQFREAAHLGSRALAERKAAKAAANGSSRGGGSSLKEHLPDTGKVKEHLPDPGRIGGGLGDMADASLAKMGFPGKLAAKVGVGHRVVEKLLPDVLVPGDEGGEAGEGDAEAEAEAPAEDEHLFDATTPLPIQESIDVAVPVAAVFDLCNRFEELPRFSDRIDAVEVEDDTHLAVTMKLGGHQKVLELEIVGEEPEERLDWDGVEGVEHSGVVTFHPLAPRLTRVELTIEQAQEGMRERLLRRVGHPERLVRQELRRFKAYAELWDEANDFKSADFKDPASIEEPPEDEADAEPPEEEADEPPEDEADEEADEPVEDDEEAAPATKD
jgi:uncharacterized membrane protein